MNFGNCSQAIIMKMAYSSSDAQVISCTKRVQRGWAPGGYSGFQVMGMIEWIQKSRPKKIPRASSKTQKNPWTKN